VSDAKLEVLLAAKNASEAAFKKFESDLGRMNSGVSLLKAGLAGLAASFSFAAVARGMEVAIDKASDLRETVSKVNTLFGTAVARDLESWGRTAAKSMGLSAQAALDAAGTMGNMFMQLGAGRQQTAVLSTSLVKLSSDLASFHNAAGGAAEVSAAMQSAFRGEYDALQRYIPTIKAAAVEQRALADTGKSSTKELTELEKAMAAYKIIMRDAGAAVGDFERTSAEHANTVRRLSSEWDNFGASLGERFLKPATAVKGVLADILFNLNEISRKGGVNQAQPLLNVMGPYIKSVNQAAASAGLEMSGVYGYEPPPAAPVAGQLTTVAGGSDNSKKDAEAMAKLRKGYAEAWGIRAAQEYEEWEERLNAEAQKRADEYKERKIANWKSEYEFKKQQDADLSADARAKAEAMIAQSEKTSEEMKNAFAGWASDFSGMLTGAVWDANFSFNSISESFGRMITQMAIQKKVIEPLFGMAFPAAAAKTPVTPGQVDVFWPTAHTGGVVGQTSWPGKHAPASIFNYAPRLHGGLDADEFPAILQRGERVIPKGGGGLTVNHTVVDNVGVKITNTEKKTSQGVDIMTTIDQMQAGNIAKRGSYSNRALRNTYGAREQLTLR